MELTRIIIEAILGSILVVVALAISASLVRLNENVEKLITAVDHHKLVVFAKMDELIKLVNSQNQSK